MIQIQPQQCTGCGACMQVCPAGAIYLIDGKATLDETLCSECAACVPVCPVEAIQQRDPEPREVVEPVHVPVPHVLAKPPIWDKVANRGVVTAAVLPMVGTVLRWASREIAPRLADHLLARAEMRASRDQHTDSLRTRFVVPCREGRDPQSRRHRWRGSK